MNVTRVIHTVDSHTAGEGTRLVVGGLPPIRGETMVEKLTHAETHLGWLPGYLLLEPRGHKDLFGALLVEPCHPEADLGLIFMDNRGYEPMCGHAVIGVAVTALETGLVECSEPETWLTLDTAAGPVRVCAQVQGGGVTTVSFDNVPSFVYRQNVPLTVQGLGDLTVDVVYGGLFFVFVAAHQVGVPLLPENAGRLAEIGMAILDAANRQIPVQHPDQPHLNRIFDVRLYEEPGGPGADSRNVVILGDHMVDRSPCGTGTSAEAAWRHHQGRLPVGESFVTESLIGTRFTCKMVSETTVGSGSSALKAIIPRVTGSATLTGFHQFVCDPRDPFPTGFNLG